MAQPRMRVSGVVLGAPEPLALAAVDRRRTAGPSCGPADRVGVSLAFEFEADYVAPTWPSVAHEPQIMEHIDVAVEDLDDAVDWATQCGATVAAVQPREQVRVMLDPAGHPFCLFRGPV